MYIWAHIFVQSVLVTSPIIPQMLKQFFSSVPCNTKWALVWYGKLTWESAHAWNLIILCYLIVWGMTFIFMVHLSFYAIPLIIYDVMNNITILP